MLTKHQTVNILVTGMGPYPTGGGGRIDNNISHALTRLLPSHLGPNTAINPSPNAIKILTLPHPIKTEYSFIRRFCRELYSTKLNAVDGNVQHNDSTDTTGLLSDIDVDNIDVIIHLGEARGWQFMSIERMAFKQGFSSSWWGLPPQETYYQVPDDKGQTIDDIGPCPWHDVPVGLNSVLNVDAISEGANAILQNRSRFAKKLPSSSGTITQSMSAQPDEMKLTNFLHPQLAKVSSPPKNDDDISVFSEKRNAFPDGPIEVRPHLEGGFYCCGFTNYESLANCYQYGRTSNVLFCHVPGLEDEKSLMWQKDGVLAIVASAANEIVRLRG